MLLRPVVDPRGGFQGPGGCPALVVEVFGFPGVGWSGARVRPSTGCPRPCGPFGLRVCGERRCFAWVFVAFWALPRIVCGLLKGRGRWLCGLVGVPCCAWGRGCMRSVRVGSGGMAPDGVLESIGGPGLLLRGVAGAAVRVLGAVVVAAVWGWVGRFDGPAWVWLGSVC